VINGSHCRPDQLRDGQGVRDAHRSGWCGDWRARLCPALRQNRAN
jgi:hypothetical protein